MKIVDPKNWIDKEESGLNLNFLLSLLMRVFRRYHIFLLPLFFVGCLVNDEDSKKELEHYKSRINANNSLIKLYIQQYGRFNAAGDKVTATKYYTFVQKLTEENKLLQDSIQNLEKTPE